MAQQWLGVEWLVLVGTLLLSTVSQVVYVHAESGHLLFPLHRRESSTVSTWDVRRLTRGRDLQQYSTLPLGGSARENGYHYAVLELGTPPKPFQLIVDTGSTLAYVPCANCGSQCGNHIGSYYDPAQSNTSSTVKCSDKLCKAAKGKCSSNKCTYAKHYAEGSSSQGVLVQDVVQHLNSVGDTQPHVVFGCESKETGMIKSQEADGLIGLGREAITVSNQLAAAGYIKQQFSLCYGGQFGGGGYVVFGELPLKNFGVEYTPLLSSPSYYKVKLKAMALGGKDLKTYTSLTSLESVYMQGMGTILDSGSTFSYLATTAFKALKKALAEQVVGVQEVTGPDPRYEDVCYQADGLTVKGLANHFPQISFVFDGGLSVTLEPYNYLFVHGNTEGAYCLAFFDNFSRGTILGGVFARDILMVYDEGNSRIGMKKTSCANLYDIFAAADQSSSNTDTGSPPSDSAASSPPPNPEPDESAPGPGMVDSHDSDASTLPKKSETGDKQGLLAWIRSHVVGIVFFGVFFTFLATLMSHSDFTLRDLVNEAKGYRVFSGDGNNHDAEIDNMTDGGADIGAIELAQVDSNTMRKEASAHELGVRLEGLTDEQ